MQGCLWDLKFINQWGLCTVVRNPFHVKATRRMEDSVGLAIRECFPCKQLFLAEIYYYCVVKCFPKGSRLGQKSLTNSVLDFQDTAVCQRGWLPLSQV